jgi:hypothetical protein
MVPRNVGDNFVWTPSGLREIKELNTGHKILGLDAKGYSHWFEIKESPLMKRNEENLLHVLSDRCEIIVSPDCELCIRGGVLKAREIRVADRIEVFNEPTYILNEVNSQWKTKAEDAIYLKGYGPVKLNLRTSYLLGILSQRTEVPALWSKDIVIVKAPAIATERVANELKEFLHDFNLTGIRGNSDWSYIEFKSKIADLVCHLPSTEELITPMLNSSFPILHSFIRGVTVARTVPINDIKRIVTKIKEINLRKVLYNLLFIHSIECRTNITKRLGEHNEYYVDVSSKDLQTFDQMEISLKSLSAWTRVKVVNEIKSASYLLNGEKNFWSPVIDLVVLA